MKYTVEVNKYGTFWYKEGMNILHRENGPAVECVDGTKEWFLNDKRHREDGPAIEHADGTKYWYLNGKLHRIDGPAIEHADGIKEWFLDDVEYTEENYKKELDKRSNSCNNKVVEIDGKKYKLVSVEE